MSTGTKRIIQAYIANGGAAMDEEHYQAYKLAILTKWLDGSKMFELLPLIYSSPIRYACLDPLCDGVFTVDEAITHLKVHRPECFDKQLPPRKGESHD